jgi:hypothetical protein
MRGNDTALLTTHAWVAVPRAAPLRHSMQRAAPTLSFRGVSRRRTNPESRDTTTALLPHNPPRDSGFIAPLRGACPGMTSEGAAGFHLTLQYFNLRHARA